MRNIMSGEGVQFLSDPGKPGVQSLGPDALQSEMLCRLNWCDSGWWRYQLMPTDNANRAIQGHVAMHWYNLVNNFLNQCQLYQFATVCKWPNLELIPVVPFLSVNLIRITDSISESVVPLAMFIWSNLLFSITRSARDQVPWRWTARQGDLEGFRAPVRAPRSTIG